MNVNQSFSGTTTNEIIQTYAVTQAMYADALSLEDVQITLSLSGLLSDTTGYNNGDGTGSGAILGDMEVWLLSPNGTLDRLLMDDRNLITSGTGQYNVNRSINGGALTDWTFLSNAYWGESIYGTWTIELFDDSLNPLTSGNMGTWDSFAFAADTGVLTVVPEPATWALLGAGLAVVLYWRSYCTGGEKAGAGRRTRIASVPPLKGRNSGLI